MPADQPGRWTRTDATSKPSASSPPASRTRSTRRPSSSATRSASCGTPSRTCCALQEVQRELREAAEAGTVTPELLARVRAAEEAADLEYLRERVPAAFERAEDGLGRVGAVVGAMRELALPPAAEKAPADLNEALRTTLVAATNAYKYVADVATDLGELPPVVCHGAELHQVFLSLIVNAAQAIEALPASAARSASARARDGDHVLITVADTGHGIAADVARSSTRSSTRVGAAWQGLARARRSSSATPGR